MPLSDHSAALVAQAVGCLECGSKHVDVFYAHRNRIIVSAAKTPHCRICDNPIPEPFRSQFRGVTFCPLCVSADRISDAEVGAANGTLFPGEPYRAMANQFRDDETLRLRWLRKAVKEGDATACSTLGDLLSRSTDPSDLTEAASAYKTAADQNNPGSYVQRRLAEMMLRGRGIQADKEAAVRLFYAAGQNGSSVALSILAQFIFKGEFGLTADPCRAFDLFTRAYEMNPNGMMNCAAVALMLLEGIGVEPDVGKGTKELRLAISIYAQNKPAFDADACFEQVMAARELADGSISDLLSARAYLDWIARFGVPGAMRLLERCGGVLPPHEPQWELSLSSALPEKIKGHVWWVTVHPIEHVSSEVRRQQGVELIRVPSLTPKFVDRTRAESQCRVEESYGHPMGR